MYGCAFLDRVTGDHVVQAYRKFGYTFFENGDFNLNIFGIRSSDRTANTFNDLVGIMFQDEGSWVLKKYDATTDPGLYWRLHPMNVDGTAIVMPGQHRGAFRIGYHQGKYKALVQASALPLCRDNNKDEVLDIGTVTSVEMAGINIHRATAISGGVSKQVDKWSAGCQVLAGEEDFAEFMRICDLGAARYGSTFTYTLFNECDFFG